MRRFFAPDKKKCKAFFRAQKNVAEKKPTKGEARLGFFVARATVRRRSAYRPVMRSTSAFKIVILRYYFCLVHSLFLFQFPLQTQKIVSLA
jgi:hypothetical protein